MVWMVHPCLEGARGSDEAVWVSFSCSFKWLRPIYIYNMTSIISVVLTNNQSRIIVLSWNH